jgi:hypothetical protein
MYEEGMRDGEKDFRTFAHHSVGDGEEVLTTDARTR